MTCKIVHISKFAQTQWRHKKEGKKQQGHLNTNQAHEQDIKWNYFTLMIWKVSS